MKLPEKIIVAVLASGFVVMTILLCLMNIAFDKALAMNSVESTLYGLKGTCSEDFQKQYGKYLIIVENKADSRIVTATWNTFFKNYSFSLGAFNLPECQN